MRIKDDPKIPIIVVGNKCDLKSERVVETAEGQEAGDKLKCPFFESSAKMKTNVDEVFIRATRLIRSYEDARKIRLKKKKGFCIIL